MSYYYDIKLGWHKAAIQADHGETRDLIVHNKLPGSPRFLTGVLPYDGEHSGWTDEVPDDLNVPPTPIKPEPEPEPDPEPEPEDDGLPFDPGELNVDELVERLEGVNDLEVLAQLHQSELDGKARKTAIEAFEDRASAIPSQGDGDHDEHD